MKVVSYQNKNVLDELLKNGYYYLKDNSFIEIDFEDKYLWMMSKMTHLENKYDAKYPIWVYTRNEHLVPSNLNNKNDIKLILDIPDDLILESNHTYYENYVLSNIPLARNIKEADLQDKLYLDEDEIYKNCPEVVETWNEIFNLNTENNSNWDHSFIKHPSQCIWQGVVWYLNKSWICSSR